MKSVLPNRSAAAVLGALAVFFLLAVIMTGTRKLDWYRLAESRKPTA